MSLLDLLGDPVLDPAEAWHRHAGQQLRRTSREDLHVSRDPLRLNLETSARSNRGDPAQRERHSMELLRDAPMDMGLGIKREAPRHY
mgnify:CR=1 FL=1